MKKLLTIFCLVLLVSCSPPPEVPSNQLVERQGIKYEINSTTPFTGSSVSYHENGQLKSRENYKDGEIDGLYEGFYDNGQLETRTNYKIGTEEGLQEEFFDNGQLQEKRNIENGELVLHQTFNQEGNPLNDLTFNNGKKTGVEVGFRENDQLWWRGNYKNNKRDGLWEWFYNNGQLWEKRNYKNELLEGPYEYFYENGKLMTRGNYKDGKQEGFWELYYENGQLQSRGNYKNGKRDGLREEFYKNGQLAMFFHRYSFLYCNGKLNTANTHK